MKLKRIVYLLLLLAVMPILASCGTELPDDLNNTTVSEGDQNVTKYLRASVGHLSFKAAEGSESITITSNVSWSIQCDQTWCKIGTSSGSNNGTVIVNVSENTSTSARNAIITISSSDANSVQISVSQDGGSPVMQLNKSDMSFGSSSGDDAFTITSNTNWTITSSQTWCKVSPTSGSGNSTITVTVSENTSTNSRTATISVNAGNLTQTIAVSQTGVPASSQSTRTFKVNGVSFRMIRVEGGTFTMGTEKVQGDARYWMDPETQQVTLSNYNIGETEVTQELWQAVMGSNPSNFKGSQKPVEQVSWDDCQDFIKKLNALTDEVFSLPTEAEWEFAARGGNLSHGYNYAGSKNRDDVAWYSRNSNGETHNVATKFPNELGLYDMSGNVWEWCQDWWAKYSSTPQMNPTGPLSGSYRVFRGGGWGDGIDNGYSSVWLRMKTDPSGLRYNRGLRLALH